jgi:signal transduction histidine kinase
MTPTASALDHIGFDTLFDATPAPYLVIAPDLTILAANAAYLAVAGRARASIVGLHIFDAFPDNPDDPHADGVAKLHASLQQVLATGRTDKMAVIRYDVAPDAGGRVFLPRYWKSTNTPVLAADGTVRCIIQSVEEVTSAFVTRGGGLRGVLASVTDVIRDLATPEAIGYEAAAILGVALDTSRVGFGTIDPVRDTLHVVRDWCADGVDTLAGETALRDYGHFIDDLKLGKLIVIGDVEHDSRTAQAAGALRARSAGAFVNVPVVEHGALVAVLFVNNAERRDWSVEELLLIREVAARIRTAGERLRATAALRDSNDRKDEFLAMLAHELRNPLAPIASAAHILLLNPADADGVRRAGEVIMRQARHLTGLVDDLLDVSRVTHGMIEIDRAALDLQQVLHSAVEQAQPLIDARAHRLALALGTASGMVLGDKLRLVQVVVNLLNNAAKYTPPGGAIALSLEIDGDRARITVTDNGMGIEPALLPHVFDLFIQARRTPDRKQGGLGLGLTLVQRIAALHDGTARAFSDGPGLGSRFVITLPLLAPLTTD